MRETTAAQCPIHPMETQPCPVCLATMDNSMASYNTGHAAGYRAAQAARPPREPTQAMVNAGEKRRREIAGRGLCIGTIWCAMYDAWAQEQTSGGTQQRPEQASASKPESRPGPLDPIADLTGLLARLTIWAESGFTKDMRLGEQTLGEDVGAAVAALERLARTERLLRACMRHETARAERAEAERDALRECVRAADAMALECRRVGLISSTWLEDYDDARAKVKP